MQSTPIVVDATVHASNKTNPSAEIIRVDFP